MSYCIIFRITMSLTFLRVNQTLLDSFNKFSNYILNTIEFKINLLQKLRWSNLHENQIYFTSHGTKKNKE